MSDWLWVLVAVNDGNGMATGFVDALDIMDAEHNHLISLEAPLFPDEENPNEDDLHGPSCEIVHSFLIIGGKSYPKKGHSSYVGNIVWDGVRASEETAKQIVRDCLAADWHAQEWVMGEGWSPEELAGKRAEAS